MAGGTLRVARPCGCAQETFMGQKRDKKCPCGNLFERPDSKGKPRRAMQRSQLRRDWTAADAKHQAEGKCRNCEATTNLERAHITGRKFDEPTHPGSRVLYVNPNRIFTLCGPFPDGCHGEYDHKRLDVLHLLTPEEQLQAVADYGSIESARRRLAPSLYRDEAPSPMKEGVRG